MSRLKIRLKCAVDSNPHSRLLTGIADAHVEDVLLERLARFLLEIPAESRLVHGGVRGNLTQADGLCVTLVQVGDDFLYLLVAEHRRVGEVVG